MSASEYVTIPARKLKPRRYLRHLVERGARIRIARSRAGLSVADIAEKVGISRQGICQIEQGRYGGKIDTLIAIARALNVSIADLLG